LFLEDNKYAREPKQKQIRRSENVNTMYNAASVPQGAGYGLDDRGIGVRFPTGARYFSLFHNVKAGFVTHPVSGGVSRMVKRPGHEADHSPPPIAEVKNDRAILGCSLASCCVRNITIWCINHAT
jgi:hypothetical protein